MTTTPHLTPSDSQPAPHEKGNPMIKLLLTLHLWGLTLYDQTLDRATATIKNRHTGRDERGSVTIEQVIWAGAVIVIVGIVVAAITGYVKTQSGKIK